MLYWPQPRRTYLAACYGLCQLTLLLISLGTNHAHGEIIIDQEIAYGSHPLQKLDAYYTAESHDAIVILAVHGGAWYHGDKAGDGFAQAKSDYWVGEKLIFVSVNYRLMPEVNPLDQVQDIASALAFVRQHASEWGGDGERIVLLGHSAGAHLVSLLASRADLVARPSPIAGTISLDNGAFDIYRVMRLRRHAPFFDAAFGTIPKVWYDASASNFVTSAMAPLLAVCSNLRPNACDQAQSFAQAAQAVGAQVQVVPVAKTYQQVGLDIGVDLSYTQMVDQFLARVAPELAELVGQPHTPQPTSKRSPPAE